jgi:RimJ/RimL family protein N-acetyltransferase
MTSLLLMTLPDLDSLLEERSVVHGAPVIDGALPPDFIIDAALESLRRREDPLWSSFFVFVDASDGAVAGSGGFKSVPHEGEVESGYGVAPGRRGRGVATSAMRELMRLARATPGVTQVVAETAVDNVASRHVVEKAGFSGLALANRGKTAWSTSGVVALRNSRRC